MIGSGRMGTADHEYIISPVIINEIDISYSCRLDYSRAVLSPRWRLCGLHTAMRWLCRWLAARYSSFIIELPQSWLHDRQPSTHRRNHPPLDFACYNAGARLSSTTASAGTHRAQEVRRPEWHAAVRSHPRRPLRRECRHSGPGPRASSRDLQRSLGQCEYLIFHIAPALRVEQSH